MSPSRLARVSDEIAERCRRLEGSGLRTFVDDPPLTWERARGATIEDADGRSYIDLYAGFAVAAVGHQHPAVVEAVRRQAGELMHCPSAHPSRVRAEFLEALASIAPPGLARAMPAITGAMANEFALAIARVRRPGAPIVTFEGSYFGRSAGTVGLAGKVRYREALGVEAAGRFLPYPAEPEGTAGTDRVVAALEAVAAPAAVIVEPVQGNGGVVVPPPDFLPRLRDVCDRTGALLVVDEIQSGCGRTGRMWACERTGVTPDLMTVGKGIGGGLAAAALLGREEPMSVLSRDALSSTFLTNNLNLAGATAAIGVLRDEDLPARAADLGERVAAPALSPVVSLPGVAELRGVGLWFGIRFAGPDGAPDPGRAAAVVRGARDAGAVVGRGGPHEDVVKISPPLVIDEDDLAEGLARLVRVVAETGPGS